MLHNLANEIYLKETNNKPSRLMLLIFSKQPDYTQFKFIINIENTTEFHRTTQLYLSWNQRIYSAISID